MDLKELRDELGKTFHEYKEQNDKRDAERKELGEATALTKQKVENLNEKMDKLVDSIKAAEEEAKVRMDALETAQQRPNLGGDVGSTKDGKLTDEYKKAALMEWCRKGNVGPEEQKALTVADDTQAGYLAPTEYVREIIKTVTEFSPIRSVARVTPIGVKSIQIPKRTGQFSAQWVGEVGTKSETTGLTYGLEELVAHEMYALVDISNAMLEDSAFSLDAELRMEFAEQFGVAEATAFVTGNAVGKPEGITVNSDVSVVDSGHATEIRGDGLISMWASLKAVYAARATWLMNRNTLGEIRKLKDGNGQYLWQPGIAGNVPNSILGSPYVECTDFADIGAGAKVAAYGDFTRGYRIVDRITIAITRDPFTQSATGKVRFNARKRVGGQVVLPEAIKVHRIAA